MVQKKKEGGTDKQNPRQIAKTKRNKQQQQQLKKRKKKKNRDKRIGTGPAPVGGSCEGGKVDRKSVV